MSYTEILVLICLCIFVVVLLYITVQLTKGINLQIRTCGKMAKWAKQELERKEERRMSDLIKRQDAIDACHNWDDGENAYAYGDIVMERLQALPSAERKRGEWIGVREISREYIGDKCVNISYKQYKYFKCSKCGCYAYEPTEKYCHACGADMRGDEDDN